MSAEIEPRRLAVLAVEIRTEVAAAEEDFQSAVQHAIRAGALLIEAKAQVKHGQWLPWLEGNFPASSRSAQGYMRLAKNAEDAQALAHLGIEGALKQLAEPKQMTPEEARARTDALKTSFEQTAVSSVHPPWRAAAEEQLTRCKHLTREQWHEFIDVRCGELFLLEILTIYSYGYIRETDPDHEILREAREAVAGIASDGSSLATRRWARDVIGGERPPKDFWATKRKDPHPEILATQLRALNGAQWALARWLQDLSGPAFDELGGVCNAADRAAMDNGGTA
jgi:Protein of unknown function (DUF3102)